jgi:ribose transport system permease protein
MTALRYRYPGRYMASWGALVLLVVVVTVAVPAALNGTSMNLVTALAGVLALAALGQMLIVMLGAIDLSVPGALAASAGVVVHYGTPGSNLPVVIIAAVLVAAIISVVNGMFISVFRLNAIIVTLAMYGIVRGAVVLLLGVSFSVTGQAPELLIEFAHLSVLNVNICFIFAVASAGVLVLLLSRTRAGRQVAAIGANRRAALMQGIRIARVELVVFAVGGILYGAAGVLVAGFVGRPGVSIGAPYQLSTITAVAIAGAIFSGGPASASAVLVASLFLELLDQSLAIYGASGGVQVAVQGAALALAVAALTLWSFGRSGWQSSLGLPRPPRRQGRIRGGSPSVANDQKVQNARVTVSPKGGTT